MLRPCLGPAPGAPCPFRALTPGTRCRDCAAIYDRERRPSPTERYGPGYQARHRQVYGLPCALRLPGCTGVATTADHSVPVARGGVDSVLVPACRSCNSAKGNR